MERHKDQPFAVVGVNTDGDRNRYREQAAEHGVTWRSAWQGSTAGPLPRAWGIDSYPTSFVLDADRVIRHVDLRGEELAQAVTELLAEVERR